MAALRRLPREADYLEVGGVRVDRKIFTLPYTCDPFLYGCQSQCCYRGCIVNQREIDRIARHLSHIGDNLPPSQRDARFSLSSFVADCKEQCPQGCEIHCLEWEAVRLHFSPGEDPRCLSYPAKMCLFAYQRGEVGLCAIHAYALKVGMELSEIKPLDCIQYPLYLGEDGEGRLLGIQQNPHFSHLPCLLYPRGKPMVISLGYAIEALLGKGFYERLLDLVSRPSWLLPASGSF
jgi:hypothetical protein